MDCERECSKRDFRYFGREFKGQCFCGSAIESVARHGRAEGGCDCCGENVGGGKICVWEVSEGLVASFYTQSYLN